MKATCIGEIDKGAKDINALTATAKKFLNDASVNSNDCKELLRKLHTKIEGLSRHQVQSLCSLVVDAVKNQNKQNIYFEEDAMFRRDLAQVQASFDDQHTACTTLSLINYGDLEQHKAKTDDYLTIAEWWFELEDSVNAETYVNRVKHIVFHVEDRSLQLRFKYANIMLSDSKRDFQQAALGYFNLSNEAGLD